MEHKKSNVAAKAWAERDKETKGIPDPYDIKQQCAPRARWHPTELQTCEKAKPKKFSASIKQQPAQTPSKVDQWCLGPCQASSLPWHYHSCCTCFRVMKDTKLRI